MDEQQYIEQRLDHQLNWYSRQAQRNQKWHRWLRLLEIVLAASIPFLASLIKDEPSITAVISLLSVLIVVISGLLALYKFQENWIEYRMTAEALKHEKFLFLTRTAPYNIQHPFPLLVERVEAILDKQGASWAGYIRQSPEPAVHTPGRLKPD